MEVGKGSDSGGEAGQAGAERSGAAVLVVGECRRKGWETRTGTNLVEGEDERFCYEPLKNITLLIDTLR